MSKYKGLKRDQLEQLVVEKLTWFLKYLDRQSSYPMQVDHLRRTVLFGSVRV